MSFVKPHLETEGNIPSFIIGGKLLRCINLNDWLYRLCKIDYMISAGYWGSSEQWKALNS